MAFMPTLSNGNLVFQFEVWICPPNRNFGGSVGFGKKSSGLKFVSAIPFVPPSYFDFAFLLHNTTIM